MSIYFAICQQYLLIRKYSLNTRSLRCNKKRRKVYKWLKKHKGQNRVTCVQVTPRDQTTENSWRHQWAGSSYFNHDSSNSRGVMMLIGKYLDYELKEKKIDIEGRFNFVLSNSK